MSDPARAQRAFGRSGEGTLEAEHGPALVLRLQGLLKGLRLYDPSNHTVHLQLAELAGVLAALGGDECVLVGMGSYFYLNGFRIREPASQAGAFRSLQAEFESRGLAGATFRAGVTITELAAFLTLVLRHHDRQKSESLARDCAALGITQITPVLTRDLAGHQPALESGEPESDAQGGPLQQSRKIYQSAVQGARRAVTLSARSGRPAIQQARRVVQPLVDSILKREYSLVGLTALKDHDEYTYAHCVNVSILSIRMGQALGLARTELAHLGVAALLHDVGKIAVPLEVLQKPGRLDESEWASIRRHPLEGFKSVCRLPHANALMLETARVALQHHVNMDRSGYPRIRGSSPMATSSRIVAVADFFDAVTAHRAYRARPMTGFEALRLLLRDESAKFDPAALWGLVQAVGCYPAGTVFSTRSGHLALSIGPLSDDLRRPHCRVLRFADGSEPSEDAPVYWRPIPDEERIERIVPPEEFEPGEEWGLAA